ncbi:MAG: hypothetical protein MUC83_15740 [Pirellula sp.]|nr:hypothetical protein [Pirellula sp.]
MLRLSEGVKVGNGSAEFASGKASSSRSRAGSTSLKSKLGVQKRPTSIAWPPKEFAFLTDMQRVLSAHQRVLRFRPVAIHTAWG